MPERYFKAVEDVVGDMTVVDFFERYGLGGFVKTYYDNRYKGGLPTLKLLKATCRIIDRELFVEILQAKQKTRLKSSDRKEISIILNDPDYFLENYDVSGDFEDKLLDLVVSRKERDIRRKISRKETLLKAWELGV